MKQSIKACLYNVITGGYNNPAAFLARVILRALSFIFGLAVRIRVFLYAKNIISSYRANLPVISVGNITAGGTGKTPLEDYLLDSLKKDRKIALISRGYDKDELNLIQYKHPDIRLLAGSNRQQLVKKAQDSGDIDLILLDDGFQHLGIRRDLDIVAVDAMCPFSNGYLLPAGLLRERPQALRRADIIILTKADLAENLEGLKEKITTLHPQAPLIESRHEASSLYEPQTDAECPLDIIKGRRVFAFCAIGSPHAFRLSLERLGAEVAGFRAFLDHYHFTPEDINELIKASEENQAECIVTTEKDWMRLDEAGLMKLSAKFKFLVLKIRLKITSPADILIGRINDLFSS